MLSRLLLKRNSLVRYVENADRYRIIAGENRCQAAKQAGLTELPCWERAPEQSQILLQQVVENWFLA